MAKTITESEVVAELQRIKKEEPHGLLRVAIAAGIGPETLRRLMKGASLKPITMSRIAAALNGKAVR